MKITIEGGGELDEMTASMYLAAVIGPFRRPNGRPRQQALAGVGVQVQLAQNNTHRAMFVSVVAVVAAQTVAYSLGGDASVAFPVAPLTGFDNFILRPGEALFGAATAPAATVVNVFTETF